MNKRGHTPTIILFVMAILLVVTAWFSFLTVSGKFDVRSAEFYEVSEEMRFSTRYIQEVFSSSVDEAVSLADKDNFEVSFKQNFEQIVAGRDLRLDFGGNFFGKVRNSDYLLTNENGVYTISIDGVSVQSNAGQNEIKRTFTLERSFSYLDNNALNEDYNIGTPQISYFEFSPNLDVSVLDFVVLRIEHSCDTLRLETTFDQPYSGNTLDYYTDPIIEFALGFPDSGENIALAQCFDYEGNIVDEKEKRIFVKLS